MFGTDSRMKTLAARKPLLVRESELHRAQLLHEVEAWQLAAQGLTRQVRSANSMVSRIAQTVSSVRDTLTGKCSWLMTVTRGVRLGASLLKKGISSFFNRCNTPQHP